MIPLQQHNNINSSDIKLPLDIKGTLTFCSKLTHKQIYYIKNNTVMLLNDQINIRDRIIFRKKNSLTVKTK